jgi:mannose-1-phosphate guanylyltransferase
MILAAGLGTRLRPLTDELPKPLVPVGDRAAVAHVAERLARAGLREAVLNTHHLAAAFTDERLAALPLRLRVIHEPVILGTGGGVAHAAPLLGDGEVILWNGDILADVDVAALLRAHRRGRPTATLVSAPRPVGEGTLGIAADGAVVRLRGERFGEEARGGDFLGIYVVEPKLRARLPAQGCLVGDGCLPALRAGERLETFSVATAWDDIGAIASYLQANERWLNRLGKRAYVGEDADVAPGVTLEDSVVGANARIHGRGIVRGSVIWPGAEATAPLDRVVVTTAGVIARG